MNATNASVHAWFNGEIVSRETGAPSVASISFHLGTGVFDGLIAYWNDDHYYIHCAEPHMRRFKAGAARMSMDFPWTVDRLLSGIELLLSTEEAGTQYIRPIAYRRAPELWVTGSVDRPVDVCIFTVRVNRDNDASLACQLSPVERISSRAIPQQTKVSGAYVNSFHARRTAELAGFDDGIMLDREGRICEASAANFFAIKNGRLLTPALNSEVFPGITRQVVIELATRFGIDVHEIDLYAPDIQHLDGAFLCSTLMELRPLSRLDGHHLSTVDQCIYKELLCSFRAVTHQ
jgi:branched-chain amino acid aminotransferase